MYYVFMVSTFSRVWINRVWVPILLVVSWKGKINISPSPFALQNLVSRDRFDSHGRSYFPRRPKRLRVRRVQSRTGAESVCGLDVNQSPSQPTKYIPLMVHKAPELTKLQAESYVGVRYTCPLELAHETEQAGAGNNLLL